MSTGCGGSLAALKVADGLARVNILWFHMLLGAKPEHRPPCRNTAEGFAGDTPGMTLRQSIASLRFWFMTSVMGKLTLRLPSLLIEFTFAPGFGWNWRVQTVWQCVCVLAHDIQIMPDSNYSRTNGLENKTEILVQWAMYGNYGSRVVVTRHLHTQWHIASN